MSQPRAEVMEPDKNLHARIPPTLLTEAEKLAQDEHITVDELVQEAMERCLRERRRQKLRAYGEAQTRNMGITTEEDVERASTNIAKSNAHARITNAGADK